MPIVLVKTDYCATKIVDFMFLGETFTPPATWYLAQFTADPGRTGSLDYEVSDPSYERQAVTFSAAALDDDGGAVCANVYDLEFPEASEDQGEITHVMLMDAETGGKGWYKGELVTPKVIGEDDFSRFPAGYLILGER